MIRIRQNDWLNYVNEREALNLFFQLQKEGE